MLFHEFTPIAVVHKDGSDTDDGTRRGANDGIGMGAETPQAFGDSATGDDEEVSLFAFGDGFRMLGRLAAFDDDPGWNAQPAQQGGELGGCLTGKFVDEIAV